jgi:hypothetical protein
MNHNANAVGIHLLKHALRQNEEVEVLWAGDKLIVVRSECVAGAGLIPSPWMTRNIASRFTSIGFK